MNPAATGTKPADEHYLFNRVFRAGSRAGLKTPRSIATPAEAGYPIIFLTFIILRLMNITYSIGYFVLAAARG